MNIQPLIDSVIRLYIPFKTVNKISFRSGISKNNIWHIDNTIHTGFYLKYIDRIFNKDELYGDCVIYKTEFSDKSFTLNEKKLSVTSARIFSFETDVAFLELSIPLQTENPDELADISSKLRLSNIYHLTASNGSTICINDISSEILNKLGKVIIFNHLPPNSDTRPELFISVVLREKIENLDMHAYRLAHGLDSRYNNTSPPDKFFSNFDYIKWAITKRGVCNIGILTENEENRKFILEDWLKYSDTRYSIWYILVLHQKYALYQYMNDVANKNTLGNLREFQKKIMLFNTKYRFSIISEESSYQHLYEKTCEEKGLENEFNDIDDEIARISEYHESKAEKNNTVAMTILSILCLISAIRDCYQLLSVNNIFGKLSSAFSALSSESQFLFCAFIIIILIALVLVIPKESIKHILTKICRETRRLITKIIN